MQTKDRMVFSSPIFLFGFLPLVLLAYFCLLRAGVGIKNAVLVAFSLLFYAWGEGIYIVVMLTSIVTNHVIAVRIAQSSRPADWLKIGLVFNLLMLGTFKYAGFFVEQLNPLLGLFGVGAMQSPSIHLPLGISFFTFQSISFLVDVYRGHAEVPRSLGTTALYISLFPQLIAGPIVRYQTIAEELVSRRETVAGFESGVLRFVTGLGKKMLIANPLGAFVDYAFSLPPDNVTASVAWLAMICYSLQIYFDFSGYSDMAIGLGRMFGFSFPENFNYPYIARSIQEFWRRWHMTLSTWFRDYLYIPLGGSYGPRWRTYCNLLLVFFLCGLWHGASVLFVAWGLYHGAFLILERTAWGKLVQRLPAAAGVLYAFFVVTLGWVVFRAESWQSAELFWTRMFFLSEATSDPVGLPLYFHLETKLALLCGLLGASGFPRWLLEGRYGTQRVSASRTEAALGNIARSGARAAFVVGILLLISAKLSTETYNPFIYFRF